MCNKQQILLTFSYQARQRKTYWRKHSWKGLCLYQLSGFRERGPLFNASALTLLLPERAIFGRSSVRTIVLEQIWGPSCCSSCSSFPHRWHFAVVLQRWLVWRNIALKTFQRVWNEQVNFQASNYDFLWHVRSVKHQKQGIGRNNLPLFLHRYTANLNNTLSLQLISDLNFWHRRQLTTSDHTAGRGTRLIHRDVHRADKNVHSS